MNNNQKEKKHEKLYEKNSLEQSVYLDYQKHKKEGKDIPEIKESDLPKYDESILINNLNSWKTDLLQIYDEETINLFLEISRSFNLKKARPSFGIFRQELKVNNNNVNQVNIDNPNDLQNDINNIKNNNNKNNIVADNIKDSEEWSKIDEDTKKEYRRKSKNENKMYEYELYFISNLLFFGYDGFNMEFTGDAKTLFELKHKLEIYRNCKDNKDKWQYKIKGVNKTWDTLPETEKDYYKNQYKKLKELRESLQKVFDNKVNLLYKQKIEEELDKNILILFYCTYNINLI